MKSKDSLRFRDKTKYVVERKVEGEQSLFWCGSEDTIFQPENDVDSRVASVICDKDFLLEGFVADETFYVSDLLHFGGTDYRKKPWTERYKKLRSAFRWNSSVQINKPIVVTNRSEMVEAFELFQMLDYSNGVVVKGYNSDYTGQRVHVPERVLNG